MNRERREPQEPIVSIDPMEMEDFESSISSERIIDGLRNMPSLEPPPILMDNVMSAVRSVRRPWTYRFYRWMTAPRHFTFTMLKAAPVLMALVFMGIFSSIHLFREDVVHVFPNGLSDGVAITLSIEMGDAASIAVVGSFNAWNPDGYHMSRDEGTDTWTLTFTLPLGRYEYAFMIDDKKIVHDPHALLRQDDGFGNKNAVLIVGSQHEMAI